MDDLKKLNRDNDGLVFDDMSFNHYPATSILHLTDVQEQRSIHGRYNNSTIPKGMPRIFTSNGNIWPMMEDKVWEAFKARVFLINIGNEDLRMVTEEEQKELMPPLDHVYHGDVNHAVIHGVSDETTPVGEDTPMYDYSNVEEERMSQLSYNDFCDCNNPRWDDENENENQLICCLCDRPIQETV